MSEPIKLARIPDRVHSLEEMFGVIRQLDHIDDIVVLVNDGAGGILTMAIDGTTSERMNWMLDRAKLLLHRAD